MNIHAPEERRPEAAPGSASRTARVSPTNPSRRHIWFPVICVASGIAFWGALSTLVRHSYYSEYYSYTVFIPLLAGYLIYRKRESIFVGSRASFRMGLPLLLTGMFLFILQRFGLAGLGQEEQLSLAVFSLVLFWMGGFAFCYGEKAFRTALFPMMFLLLTIPFPMAVMVALTHVTRVGSTEVASAILHAFGVRVFREGFLLVLPGFSVEIAKECSGIHSTTALLVLTLMGAYLFLRSSWKRALLLLAVFPIVSLTNGLRIATLSLLAEHVNVNIFNSSLHRDGGVLFFLLACGLLNIVLRFLQGSKKWTFAPWNRCSPKALPIVSGTSGSD